MNKEVSDEVFKNLFKEVNKYDDSLKVDKVRRLYKLSQLYPPELIIMGKAETVILFNEIKETYINGQHLSTIILVQIFLEKALYNHLKNLNKEFRRSSLSKMILFARSNNILSTEILDLIDKFRVIRNTIVHQTNISFEKSLANRKNKQSKKDYYQLLEDDALNSLIILFTVLEHRYFNYNLDFDFIEFQ